MFTVNKIVAFVAIFTVNKIVNLPFMLCAPGMNGTLKEAPFSRTGSAMFQRFFRDRDFDWDGDLSKYYVNYKHITVTMGNDS